MLPLESISMLKPLLSLLSCVATPTFGQHQSLIRKKERKRRFGGSDGTCLGCEEGGVWTRRTFWLKEVDWM
jgi:hypothetical protein